MGSRLPKTGTSALELHRRLGVNYRTSWLVKHKLMAVMFEQECDRRLEGVVRVDAAFLGGERTGGKRGPSVDSKGDSYDNALAETID